MRFEGLRNIRISSDIQSFHLIFDSRLCRNQNNRNVAELQTLLYFPTKPVAILSRHHYVTQNQIGCMFGNGFQCTFRIKPADYLIIGIQQHFQIVSNLGIIIYNHDCLFLLTGLCNRLHWRCIIFQRESFQLVNLFMSSFCSRISRLTNRYGQRKYHFFLTFQIGSDQSTMMQFSQATRIVKSNTCTPVIYSSMLIRNLIVPFEYLLQFVFRNLPGIDYFYFYRLCTFLSRYDIEIHINTSTYRSILQGIRHQIGKYLVNFILIDPSNETAFQSTGSQCDRFIFSINPENIRQFFQQDDNFGRTYLQFQCIVFQFVKIKHLVYQPQHPVYTTLHNTQQVLVIASNVRTTI